MILRDSLEPSSNQSSWAHRFLDHSGLKKAGKKQLILPKAKIPQVYREEGEPGNHSGQG